MSGFSTRRADGADCLAKIATALHCVSVGPKPVSASSEVESPAEHNDWHC